MNSVNAQEYVVATNTKIPVFLCFYNAVIDLLPFFLSEVFIVHSLNTLKVQILASTKFHEFHVDWET